MELQNQAILWSDPELVGWVEKRGDKSTTWNRRFFLLQGAYIFYYIKNFDISNVEPVGVIPLEGASIKDEDDSESGRRFCFLLQLNLDLATFAKRASYHISAPSQEAKVVWMHSLKMASYSQAYLMGELQVFRERASDLEVQLVKSPKSLKSLQRQQGHESSVLQKEIQRVGEAYKKLREEAIEVCTEADKVNTEAVRALAIWEVYMDYISGRNREGSCYTMNRLNAEANFTNKLLKLLTNKRLLIDGEGINHLSPQGIEDLDAVCKRGLRNILERQFQVRIKAPRYTSSVHPALLPEGCSDPIPRVSRALDMPERNSLEKGKRKSTSFQILKENDNFEKQAKDKLEDKKFLPSFESSFQSTKLKDIGSDHEYMVLQVEDEFQKNKTNLDNVEEIEGRKVNFNIETNSNYSSSENVETSLEQLAQKGLQNETMQRSLKVWTDTTEQPPSSSSSLNNMENQKPFLDEMNPIEQFPKLQYVLQKQISFSQPNHHNGDSSPPSTTSFKGLLPNDLKPTVRASNENIAIEASNPILIPPSTSNSIPISVPPSTLDSIPILIPPSTSNSIPPSSSNSIPISILPSTSNSIPIPIPIPIPTPLPSFTTNPIPIPIPTPMPSFTTNPIPIPPFTSNPTPVPSFASSTFPIPPFPPNPFSNSFPIPPTNFGPNHYQILTRPQWVQIQPQTFNIVGPTSIHTHDGGICSTPSIDPSDMQGMQSKIEESSLMASKLKSTHEPKSQVSKKNTCSLKEKQGYINDATKIDESIQINLYKSGEEQCTHDASNNDCYWPKEDQYVEVGSNINQDSLRKNQYVEVGSKFNQDSLRKDQYVEVGSKFNQDSLRKDQYVEVGSRAYRNSPRRELEPLSGCNVDKNLEKRNQFPFEISKTNQCSFRNKPIFEIESRINQNLLKKEEGSFIRLKADWKPLKPKNDSMVISKSDQKLSRRESIPIQLESNSNLLIDEKDCPFQSRTNWQSSTKEESIPIKLITRKILPKDEEHDSIQSKNNWKSSTRKGCFPIKSFINQKSIKDDGSIPIQLGSHQHSLKEKEGTSIHSITNYNSFNDEKNVHVQPRTNQQLLREEKGIPIQLITNKQSTNFQNSFKDEKDNSSQSMIDPKNLRNKTSSPTRSKTSGCWPNEDNFPSQSKNNQKSLRKESCFQIGSSIVSRTIREKGIVVQPTVNLQSIKKQENISIQPKPNWQSPRKKENNPIQITTDQYSPQRQPSPQFGSRIEQNLSKKEIGSSIGSKFDQQRTHVVSKSTRYIESIIPSKLRALFQRMQPKPRNERSPVHSASIMPFAVILSGARRDVSPFQPPQSEHVPKPAVTKIPKQKITQHVKWTNPQANGVLSPPPIKWTTPEKNNDTFQPIESRRARPQSDMQHLLWSHPRVEHNDSHVLQNETTYSHQSPKIQSPHQQQKTPQCISHQHPKHHYSHQHMDYICRKHSSPHNVQRAPHMEHANKHQTRQFHPKKCSHQCQHHHHKHSNCYHDQGPKLGCNTTMIEDSNDGWFSPKGSNEKCQNR